MLWNIEDIWQEGKCKHVHTHTHKNTQMHACAQVLYAQRSDYDILGQHLCISETCTCPCKWSGLAYRKEWQKV